MEPIDYLRAVKRRWWIPALAVLVATAAVFATAPHPQRGQRVGVSYKATATLLYTPPAGANNNAAASPVQSLAVLVTTGSVPREVAKKIGWTDSISRLVDKVTVTPQPDTNTITISSTQGEAAKAQLYANAFAHGTKDTLDAQAAANHQNALNDAQAKVTALSKQVTADQGLDQRNPVNADRLDSDKRLLAQATDRYLAISVSDPDSSQLTLLDEGVPAPVHSAIPGSGSTSIRLLLAWFLAFALGAAVVILVDRIDPRIRNKEMAERAFELPVVAEVPILARWRRSRHGIITVDEPLSMSAEAYRSLRTTLLLSRSVPRLVPSSHVPGEEGVDPSAASIVFEKWAGERDVKVILVTSPGPAEGKTTTTANLAASFAEAGQSVLIFSSDFRRPDIHSYFGLTGEGLGISNVLTGGPDAPSLTDVVQETPLHNVSLLTPGTAVHNPAELLAAERRLIESAKPMADVILVDTAPLLATNDASELIPAVDAVVLVCRAGRTGDDLALRTRELLARLGAPTIGIVLVGAQELPGARRYHSRYYGHTRTEKWKQVVKRHPSVLADAHPETPEPAPVEAPAAVSAPTPAPPKAPDPAPKPIEPAAAVAVPAATAAPTAPPRTPTPEDRFLAPPSDVRPPALEMVGAREATGGSAGDGFPLGLMAVFEEELRALDLGPDRRRSAFGDGHDTTGDAPDPL